MWGFFLVFFFFFFFLKISTTFVTLEDVRVPAKNLIGPENAGFMILLYNFNHERFVISAGACRSARLCYEEAIQFAMERKVIK